LAYSIGRYLSFKVFMVNMAVGPIDIISGIVLIVAGFLMLTGLINAGVFVASVGLLLQALKALLKWGL